MPLMRDNLLDLPEDLDNFEVGLTYKTPTEPESFKKSMETLREPLEG